MSQEQTYHYRTPDGENVGPISETELKQRRHNGVIDDSTLVIRHLADNWLTYSEQFWTPPNPVIEKDATAHDGLEPQSPPTEPSSKITETELQNTREGTNGSQAVETLPSWRDEELRSSCSTCGEPLEFSQKILGKKRFRCPICQTRQNAKQVFASAKPCHQSYRRSMKEFLFSYKGRVNRESFWRVSVLGFILFALPIAIGFLVGSLVDLTEEWDVPLFIFLLMDVALFIAFWLPTLAKRFHDIGLGGDCVWLLLLVPIPILGHFVRILLVVQLGFIKGQQHTNQFGPPPSRIRYAGWRAP